jgi:hypothetical protein
MERPQYSPIDTKLIIKKRSESTGTLSQIMQKFNKKPSFNKFRTQKAKEIFL